MSILVIFTFWDSLNLLFLFFKCIPYACVFIRIFSHLRSSEQSFVVGIFPMMSACMYASEHNSIQNVLSIELPFVEPVIGYCRKSCIYFCTNLTMGLVSEPFFNQFYDQRKQIFPFYLNFSTKCFYCSYSSYIDTILIFLQDMV